jgi:serine/threonine-protein kinase
MPQAHDRPVLALSPDGRRLAYVAQIGDTTEICVRDLTDLAEAKVTRLPGTAGGHTPFFSPDGSSIAFFSDAKLKRTPVNGGSVIALADAPTPYGCAWGRDGFIYFNRQGQEGIHRIRAEGGEIQSLTPPQHRMPEVLGAGGGFLTTFGWTIYGFADSKEPRAVIQGSGARYAPTGHLVYSVHGRMTAVAFDRSAGQVTGPPATLFEDLRTAPYGVAQFAFAEDGTLVYAPGRPQSVGSLVWVDRQGNSRPLPLPERYYSTLDLSRDGKVLAFGVETREGVEAEIWVYPIGGKEQRLTPRAAVNPEVYLYPTWSPDGRYVLYMRKREDQKFDLLCRRLDGSGEAVQLWAPKSTGPTLLYPLSFSPDGSLAVAFGPSKGSGFDIYLVPWVASRPAAGEPATFLGNAWAEFVGQISPDGHWILYTSDQSGRNEIYVTSFPKPGATYRISRDGGHKALWNPASPEILYRDGSQIFSVRVTFEPEFRAEVPRLLFAGAFPGVPGMDFDITPDGQQFVMLENREFLKPTTTLTVITNFFDELRRRVPARGSQ